MEVRRNIYISANAEKVRGVKEKIANLENKWETLNQELNDLVSELPIYIYIYIHHIAGTIDPRT